MAIGEIELDRDEGPIGQGGSGARWITAPDGSKWSAKATYFGGHGHRYFYVNEALTKLIAERLDVRVPDAAALRLTPEQAEAFSPGRSEQDRVIFACRRIEGEALTPAVVQATAAADRAGIIVLDAAVWNTDDKAEHVIAEESTGEWRLWPVDARIEAAQAELDCARADLRRTMADVLERFPDDERVRAAVDQFVDDALGD